MTKHIFFLIIMLITASFCHPMKKSKEQDITQKQRILKDYIAKIHIFYDDNQKRINEAFAHQNLRAMKKIINEIVAIGSPLKAESLKKKDKSCAQQIRKILRSLPNLKQEVINKSDGASKAYVYLCSASTYTCLFSTVFLPLFLFTAAVAFTGVYSGARWVLPYFENAAQQQGILGVLAILGEIISLPVFAFLIPAIGTSIVATLFVLTHKASRKCSMLLAEKLYWKKFDAFYTNCTKLLRSKIEKLEKNMARPKISYAVSPPLNTDNSPTEENTSSDRELKNLTKKFKSFTLRPHTKKNAPLKEKSRSTVWGVKQLGNSCWFASCIIPILTNKTFRNIFEQKNVTMKSPVTYLCAKSRCELLSKSQGDSINNLFMTISFSAFNNMGKQQDAAEGLTFILSALKKENPNKTSFQIQTKSTTTCKACSKKSQRSESHTFLTIPIEQQKNPVSCLSLINNYLKPETMSGDNAYDCSSCKKHTHAIKKETITKAPEVFIVQAKRFSTTRLNNRFMRKKIKTPLLCNDKIHINNHDYNLQSITLHTGTLELGHYIAVANIDNTWYLYDDANVTTLKKSELTQLIKNGYIEYNEKKFYPYVLFYNQTKQ